MNEEGDIVANLDAPIDIPNNANGEPRWIDIRLNSIKRQSLEKFQEQKNNRAWFSK